MTEAIDTIRNTCSRRSQEERAEKTPEQRLLKAERRANEDLPCARASTRTCVAGAHICPRILGIGTFVRMWCTVRITLKSNGGTVMTGKVAISVTTAAAPDSSCRANHGKLSDRKSTRLNSSHRCISYAVFCLKKKTRLNTLR